jgi:hypothetical protein
MNATSTPEVLARIRGRCRLCPHPIRAGEDYVTKLDRLGWVHALCAAGYRQAMAENEEDGED